VDLDPRKGLYRARGRLNGRRYYLGKFKTIEEAAAAYEAFTREHHGDFYRPQK